MLRRSFLRLVAAASVAACVSIEAFQATFPKAETRSWVWMKESRFMRVGPWYHDESVDISDMQVAHITGLRSDGTYFNSTVVIPGDVETMHVGGSNLFPVNPRELKYEYARLDVENGWKLLDSFRDCACRVGYKCPDHLGNFFTGVMHG